MHVFQERNVAFRSVAFLSKGEGLRAGVAHGPGASPGARCCQRPRGRGAPPRRPGVPGFPAPGGAAAWTGRAPPRPPRPPSRPRSRLTSPRLLRRRPRTRWAASARRLWPGSSARSRRPARRRRLASARNLGRRRRPRHPGARSGGGSWQAVSSGTRCWRGLFGRLRRRRRQPPDVSGAGAAAAPGVPVWNGLAAIQRPRRRGGRVLE